MGEGTSLVDPLQQDHVSLVLGPPELDRVLQVGSHQRKIERQSRVEGKLNLLLFADLFYPLNFLGVEGVYTICVS